MYSHWNNSVQKNRVKKKKKKTKKQNKKKKKQKQTKKKAKYRRNETMFKVGHIAKAIAFVWAIAFAKYSIWAKHLSYLRHAKIDFVFALQKIFAKKPLEINLKYSRNKMMWIIGHPKNRVKKNKKTKQNKKRQTKTKKKTKNTKYTRNETMLIIGHIAKAVAIVWVIAFAKYLI